MKKIKKIKFDDYSNVENRWHDLANASYSTIESPHPTNSEQFDATCSLVRLALELFPEPGNPVGKDAEFAIALFAEAVAKGINLVDPDTLDGAVIVKI